MILLIIWKSLQTEIKSLSASVNNKLSLPLRSLSKRMKNKQSTKRDEALAERVRAYCKKAIRISIADECYSDVCLHKDNICSPTYSPHSQCCCVSETRSISRVYTILHVVGWALTIESFVSFLSDHI